LAKNELLFLKKKNRAAGRQNNFCAVLPGDVEAPRVKVTKVFCGAFLQKSDHFLDPSKPYRASPSVAQPQPL
jgi:hypothetical protein